MLTSNEALEIIATVNDNWSNNQVMNRAVPVWINGLMNAELTFEHMIMGLASLIATETFRPTVAQIIEASTPAPEHVVVEELTDEVPLLEVIDGKTMIVGYFNTTTREKRLLKKHIQAVTSTSAPLQISEY